MNVFVFPSCNEPGLEIIRALRSSNKITLFGGSSFDVDYDPSRHLLRNYVKCPGYKDPDFKDSFTKILRECSIDIVFPAWDRLITEFAEWNVPGVRFITPEPETARILLSKTATYKRLQCVAPTPSLRDANNPIFPMFAKPDDGSGSKDTMEVRTPNDLAVAVERGLLLSEYLPGDEYTADCVSDMDGRLLFFNPRARSRIGRGIALSAKTEDDPRIISAVERIAAELKIRGPWFVQFKKNADGEPVVLEVNARIAGSMGVTRMCGVNIPLMSVFLFAGEKVQAPRPRRGVLVNRALDLSVEHEPFHVAIWDWDDTLTRKDGKPNPDAMACLFDLRNRGVRQFLLTKNPDVETLMERMLVPQVFENIRICDDKPSALCALLHDYNLDPESCVLVNDSYAERFAIEDLIPSLRTVTPDALECLGRERTE